MSRPLRTFLAALALLAAGCGSRLRPDARERQAAQGGPRVRREQGPAALPSARLPSPTERSTRSWPSARSRWRPCFPAGARPPICAVPGLRVERPLWRAHAPRGGPRPRRDPRSKEPLRGAAGGRLSEIAPTVMSEGGAAANWKLDLRLFGEALGRTNQAEGLLSGWDRTAAAARRRLRRLAGTRVAVVRILPTGQTRLARPEAFPGKVLSDAGLVPAEERRGADIVLVSRAPRRDRHAGEPGPAQGDPGGRPALVGRRRAAGRARRPPESSSARPSRPDGRVAPPRPRAWCSWRTRSPRGPAPRARRRRRS